MYARMTTGVLDTDKIDRLIAIYDKSVIPAAKAQKGFCGAYLFTDRKSGRAVSVTLWESEADATANEENLYYQKQLVKIQSLLPGSLIREGFEVSVQV